MELGSVREAGVDGLYTNPVSLLLCWSMIHPVQKATQLESCPPITTLLNLLGKQVIVTGVSGQSGKYIIDEYLLEKGREVLNLDPAPLSRDRPRDNGKEVGNPAYS